MPPCLIDLETVTSATVPRAGSAACSHGCSRKIRTIFDGIGHGSGAAGPECRAASANPRFPKGNASSNMCAQAWRASRLRYFHEVAQPLCRARSDVLFVVVGEDALLRRGLTIHGPKDVQAMGA